MKRIAVFASGTGSNAENIATYFRHHDRIAVAALISDNPKAGVHERIKRYEIPSYIFPKTAFVEGGPVADTLSELAIDWIVLAGFLRKIPDRLLAMYPDRIINVHPALLPKFGGKGMYGHHVHEAVVAAGERETGITIHYINERYDEGPAIFQASCPVAPSDTPDEVARKIHRLEQEHFPRIIEQVILADER